MACFWFVPRTSCAPPSAQLCVMHMRGVVILMKAAFVLLFMVIASSAFAGGACKVSNQREQEIILLFSGTENIHSLLWWDDPKSNIINARSFIINGNDSIPIFSSEAEAKQQIAGSGYEKDLVSVKPSLLAGILQKMEYAILNPGGKNPVQFKTCILVGFIEK